MIIRTSYIITRFDQFYPKLVVGKYVAMQKIKNKNKNEYYIL